MAWLLAPDRAAWRRWLVRHHAREAEIWLVYYKKHTGKRSIDYPEALDEALCFGWIDGIVRRMDDERYCQRFSPRTKRSRWSAVNLGHVRRLVDEGRMTEAGLVAAREALQSGPTAPAATRPAPARMPADLRAALRTAPRAQACWDTLAPSHRRQYLLWVTEAKRPETRERRVRETVRRLAAGIKTVMG
jgi:uncharacterized protein YdeI (YjbR/CyaY-like superfamily)